MNPLQALTANFSALSLKDLLSARDIFHYHLMNKKNVVATAVGLYRIRHDDEWPKEMNDNKPFVKKGKRTLFNSEVRPYSWPCVYVYVENWEDESALSNVNPVDVVPKTLFLPDGRTVPVCVIEAKKQPYASDTAIDPKTFHPRNVLVPGTTIVNENAQGLSRIATVGCIVKDGEKFYALTNKHAIGEEGTEISAFVNGKPTPIGTTAKKGITRKLVKEVYPNFSASNQYLQIDMGLIELNNITDWKTEVISIGQTENLLDLYDNNYTLKLIGLKVVGYGGISGSLRGEIQGLFYRYKALGGFEYLCDFLIGPETLEARNPMALESMKKTDDETNVGFGVHHGDSGALLLIEQKEKNPDGSAKGKPCYYPFALLWGKHEFVDGTQRSVQPYALATSLSTPLDFLELDLVRDINLDNDMVWGYIGHYAIASKLGFTVNLLASDKLKQFINKNRDLLAMKDGDIKNAAASPRVIRKKDDGTYDADTDYFVPLADVPDNVWKSNVNLYMVEEAGKKKRKTGPGARSQNDNPNHFADVDLPDANGKTLLQLSLEDPDQNLLPDVWIKEYDSAKAKYIAWDKLYKPKDKSYDRKKHWGALPFRVWQITDLMIGYAKAGQQNEFLCAGGVLIHYLGDACQPLHGSYLSQGDPDHPVKKTISKGPNKGTVVNIMRGADVHSGYEDDMINSHSKIIMEKLEDEIKRQENLDAENIIPIRSGYDAAKAVINLLQATQKTLAPKKIVDKWEAVSDQSKKDRETAMWTAFGKKTIELMARGNRYLAAIWQGAWKEGNGDTTIGTGAGLSEGDLQQLYEDPQFCPSFPLDEYKLMKNGAPV